MTIDSYGNIPFTVDCFSACSSSLVVGCFSFG